MTTETKKNPVQDLEEEFRSKIKSDDPRALWDLYKMYVSSADDISKQRQNANTFFLSVNSALIAVFGLVKSDAANYTIYGIVIVGILLAITWLGKLNSYSRMNGAKFSIINILEEKLAAMPYNYEWKFLQLERHRTFSSVEKKVPMLFVLAYVIVAALKFFVG